MHLIFYRKNYLFNMFADLFFADEHTGKFEFNTTNRTSVFTKY